MWVKDRTRYRLTSCHDRTFIGEFSLTFILFLRQPPGFTERLSVGLRVSLKDPFIVKERPGIFEGIIHSVIYYCDYTSLTLFVWVGGSLNLNYDIQYKNLLRQSIWDQNHKYSIVWCGTIYYHELTYLNTRTTLFRYVVKHTFDVWKMKD